MKTATAPNIRRNNSRPNLAARWRPYLDLRQPRLAIDEDEVLAADDVTVGEKYGSRILSIIASLFAILALIFVGVWVIIISTISATPQIDNNILLVQRAAWGVGQADIGQIAFTVPNAATSAGPRIVEAFTGYQGGMVVEIAAKPGQIRDTGSNGNLIVDNFDLGIKAPAVIPGTRDDYLAVCVAGQCQQGTVISISVSDVVGKISGVLGNDGFRDLTREN